MLKVEPHQGGLSRMHGLVSLFIITVVLWMSFRYYTENLFGMPRTQSGKTLAGSAKQQD
jgi:hypothetical protein